MANNYVQFSEMIPYDTQEQKDWLLLALSDDSDLGAPCGFEAEMGGIWVHAEDTGDVDALVDIVCRFQDRFEIDKPWSLTWAEWCDKPRLSEFGGGAVVCLGGEDHWMNAVNWADEKKSELLKEA